MLLGITFILIGRTTDSSASQVWKTNVPISTTLSGIVMLVREEQSLNANLPIEVTLEGIYISLREVHS